MIALARKSEVSQDDYDEAEISVEPEKSQRASFIVESHRIETVNLEDDKILKKLVLEGRIPEIERKINVSDVRIAIGEKIVFSGLWVELDEHKKLKFGVLSRLLKVAGLNKIKDLDGREFPICRDQGKYWAIDVCRM